MPKNVNDAEKEKQPQPRGRKALIIVGVVVLALAVLLVAYAIWERPPAIAPAPAAKRGAMRSTKPPDF